VRSRRLAVAGSLLAGGLLAVVQTGAVAATGDAPAGARERAQEAARAREQRSAAIHERYVFADIHAHPSRFHRAGVERIGADEIARYARGLIDLVVCNVSTDAAFQGGYTSPDGDNVRRLRGNDIYPLAPGEAFAFTLDRLARVQRTIDAGDEANFRAILDGLLDFGYSDDEVGKVMGGNFFRIWQQIDAARSGPQTR